jgi:uncharacterized damage-inducible protein DinB
VPALELFLRTITPRHGRAWHGGVTPVGAVRGVKASQAFWRPAPRVHTIWELTLHIAYWKYAVRRRLSPSAKAGFGRGPANWPSVPERPDQRVWDLDRAQLKAEDEAFAAALRSFPDSRLHQKPPEGRKWTYGDLIAGILAHDAYHAGQIQLLKRLWKAR